MYEVAQCRLLQGSKSCVQCPELVSPLLLLQQAIDPMVCRARFWLRHACELAFAAVQHQTVQRDQIRMLNLPCQDSSQSRDQ
jgi:hypothetical protein